MAINFRVDDQMDGRNQADLETGTQGMQGDKLRSVVRAQNIMCMYIKVPQLKPRSGKLHLKIFCCVR